MRIELFAPKPTSAALVWAARRQQSLVLEGAFPTLLQHCTRAWAKMLTLKQQKRKCTDFLSTVWELFLGVHCWRLQWCVLWKEDTVLLALVQHSTSGTADHLWGASCLFCWNVLPIYLAVCVALSNEVNQSISSVLPPLLWPLPAVLVHQCERTCHAAFVPVSVEVYMCSPPSLLKVYRQNLTILAS